MTLSHTGIQTAGYKFGSTILTFSALVIFHITMIKMVRENRDFPKNNFKERILMKDSQITFILKNSSKRKQWSLYIVRMSEMRKI